MKKLFVGLAAWLLCLTGCTKGVEKEYTMNIKSEVIAARLKEDETQEVKVVHCERGMSLYNYYIALPELEEGFVMPEHLIAKKTDNTTKYVIINEDNKSETVSDHGYKFIKWGE